MPLIWDDSYSVDNDIIDNQHKALFGLVNKLYRALRKSQVENLIDEVYDELFDYIRIHFEYEEFYMREINYSGLDEHIRAHRIISQKTKDLYVEMCESDKSFDKILELYLFLQEWLSIHVLHEDMGYKNVQ